MAKKILTIVAHDEDNNLENLLNYIKKTGNIGHSFSIVVDPEDKKYKKVFSWDGDGSDSIYEIDVKLEDEVKESKDNPTNDEKSIMKWAKNIADNYRTGNDVGIYGQLYDAAVDLGLYDEHWHEIDKRYQYASNEDFSDWKRIYFILIGKSKGESWK